MFIFLNKLTVNKGDFRSAGGTGELRRLFICIIVQPTRGVILVSGSVEFLC